MNLSGLGAGLGAVGGGYQQGMLANNQIEAGQLQNAEAQAKQIGMAAYFRALQGLTGGAGGPPGGGQGPQAPMPGQPSQPSPAPALPPGPAGPPAVMDRSGVAAPDAQGVYGRGATMQTPGAEGGAFPQAPPPGMQSAPAAMPQQGPGGPSTPGVPPGPGDQTDGQGGLRLTWQGIAHSIKANNPGVNDLALAHAVDKFVPMMAAQSQAEWRNLRTEMMGQIADVKSQAWRDTAATRADAARDVAGTRAGASNYSADARERSQSAAETGRQGRFDTSEDRRRDAMDQRDQQFQQREQRLQDSLKLRTDSTWARLDQQKQQFEQRIAQGDRRQAVTEWRATVDAQHKYAMEKILSARDMKPAERQQMIADQNGWYTGQIERMKNLTSQQGNMTDGGSKVISQTVENAPAGAQALPPAFKADPDGTSYQKGGQTWIKQGDKLIMKPAGTGPQSMSDEQPDPVRPGAQYAAMDNRLPPDKPEMGARGTSNAGGTGSGKVVAPDYGKGRLENPEGNIWYASKPLEAIRQETRVDHLRMRLGQLTRDKAATKKTGYDVESSDYMHYNTEINAIRARLRELSGGQ
jgi:hypothetical protein